MVRWSEKGDPDDLGHRDLSFAFVYLFESLFSLGNLGDIRKVPSDLIAVKAIACEPQIVDLKAVILDGYRHEKTVRIKEHRAKCDIFGLLHLQILDDQI